MASVSARDRHFHGRLAQLLGDGRPELPRLRAAAEWLRDSQGEFVSWLASVRGDQDWVHQTVARSYWHPNGFAKLTLHVSDSPEFRLRLHVWPATAGEPVGESNPHSHRWEFASTVLVGEGLHMVEYEESIEDGARHDRYTYGGDPANPAALRPDGVARLRKVRVPHVTRGDVYTCDTAVVHTVVPIDNGHTATLVVQGPHRTSSTVVYCEPGKSEDQPNRPLSESDFDLLTKWVLTSWEARA